MLNGKKIVFLGAGSLAESLIRGLTAKDTVSADQISVMNRTNRDRLEKLAQTYGIKPVREREKALKQADVIMIAVKPKVVKPLLREIAPWLHHSPLVISFAAGITLQAMAEVIPLCPIARAMPNTSCAVLQSATAVSFNQRCGEEAKDMAMQLLSAVGSVAVVEESLMDAVTGLSGSGPAYFYYLVEAMQEAGAALGLPAEVARELVVQTLYGAACMLKQTGLPAAELRRQVTSPNGTTAAGLEILRQGKIQEWMQRAIRRAAERSRELGREVAEEGVTHVSTD